MADSTQNWVPEGLSWPQDDQKKQTPGEYTGSYIGSQTPGEFTGSYIGSQRPAVPAVAPQAVNPVQPIQTNALGAMPSQGDLAKGSLGEFPTFTPSRDAMMQRGLGADTQDQSSTDWGAINPMLGAGASQLPYYGSAPLMNATPPTPRSLNGVALSSNPFVFKLLNLESGGQNIVSQTDKDNAGRTLAEGGNPDEISQGYLQIRKGTWQRYAKAAGVDTNQYPNAMRADYPTQWAVASQIPLNQYGPRTVAGLQPLLEQVGANKNMTLGEIAAKFGQVQGGAQGQEAASVTGPQAAPQPAPTQHPTQSQNVADTEQQKNLKKLMLLRMAWPEHAFTPIDYDPWEVFKAAKIGNYQL